jgi:hypothetical protein
LDDLRDDREPGLIDGYGDGAWQFGRHLRVRLAAEHLVREEGDEIELIDPAEVFAAFADSAAQLQRWHDEGRAGRRPPGRLRPYTMKRLPRRTLVWRHPCTASCSTRTDVRCGCATGIGSRDGRTRRPTGSPRSAR